MNLCTEKLLVSLLSKPLHTILDEYSDSIAYFANIGIPVPEPEIPLLDGLARLGDEYLNELGLEKNQVLRDFCHFIEVFCLQAQARLQIESLTVCGGSGKEGQPELSGFELKRGEIISVVGSTGSGKSRLLADIECLACGDTVTGRRILLNQKVIEDSQRERLEGRLVAQLSQNMNFVMDLSVADFLNMHAQSRMVDNPDELIVKCYDCAISLAGEKFELDTKITQLSGGQSRALMIADVAHLSDSPVVLIDEIENAGIDRRKAVKLLAKAEKIVLMSTHDPLLALSADLRVVIRNGAMSLIIKTDEEEKKCLAEIEALDSRLLKIRTAIRNGRKICLTDI